MTVYADVLVVVNYIVNLFLMLAAVKLAGAVVSRKRICLSALLGAAGSLIIFLPYIGFWFQFLYKFLLAGAMTAAAFRFHPWQRFVKGLFITFAVSFVFAGFMLALSFLLAPAGMLFYNGVVYFDISAILLILTTGTAYLFILLFERLFSSRVREKELYDITILMNGKAVVLKGLADTGSDLREPFSGAPVIVCDRERIQCVQPDSAEKIRIIPCLTVTGEGALEGFQPDELLIAGGGRFIHTGDVYIASSREPIHGDYQALINPRLL